MKFYNSNLIMAFCLIILSTNISALNYSISFTGSGASTTVGDVIVQNITQNTSITVPAGNTLNLYDGANAVEQVNKTNQGINIYSTSGNGKSTISFYAKQAGATQVSAYSLEGRKLVGINTYLQTGVNSFQLSLTKGSYIIYVVGAGYTYNAKMIQQSATLSKPEIVYLGTNQPTSSSPQKIKNATIGVTSMLYRTGDQLLYKGFSGKNSTLVADIPTTSKTTNFNFVECVDGDGNYYSTVTIGTQTWMAENLKTTRYNDRYAIPNVTVNSAWKNLTTPAYCYFTTNTTFPKNGGLYNWYAVGTGKLAPTGWHVSTDAEWTVLENYLMANGYNYDGSISENKYAKSLAAAATDWTTNTNYGTPYVGAPDNNIRKNNSTGFSAVPNGIRLADGIFGLFYNSAFFWCDIQENEFSAWDREIYYESSQVRRATYPKQGGHSVRCVKDLPPPPPALPIITSTVASAVTSYTATSGGSITSDSRAPITARGICWSTSADPTIALDTKTVDGSGIGTFSSSITGLTPATMYYVRAYATNSVGTAYGNQVTFSTLPIKDIDGNVYTTIKIGTQTWMVENLRTTKYNDGTPIANQTDGFFWSKLTTGAYCWNKNEYNNSYIYGALYNWYAVNTAKLAPTGWHIPTDAEWTVLENYLIANKYNYDTTTVGNNYAKSIAAKLYWGISYTKGAIGNDLTKNNSSGFSALPGGFLTNTGYFTAVGKFAKFWSSTAGYSSAWGRELSSESAQMNRTSLYKEYGCSVRCIKD